MQYEQCYLHKIQNILKFKTLLTLNSIMVYAYIQSHQNQYFKYAFVYINYTSVKLFKIVSAILFTIALKTRKQQQQKTN